MNNSEHSCEPESTESTEPAEPTGCVLLVDDDDRVRQMLSRALRSAGFDVVVAGTQRQVQRRLAHNRPDALILNLQRSEADGLDTLLRMRARHDLGQVPILFLAGCDSGDFRWEVIRAGADWFGLRPLGMNVLQKRIARLIRDGRPRLKVIFARERSTAYRRLKPTA
jgi:two-component system OmpR family response regulator